jgi:hypothetical protein
MTDIAELQFRAAGAFAGPLRVLPGATGQTRFLAVLGRAG